MVFVNPGRYVLTPVSRKPASPKFSPPSSDRNNWDDPTQTRLWSTGSTASTLRDPVPVKVFVDAVPHSTAVAAKTSDNKLEFSLLLSLPRTNAVKEPAAPPFVER